MPRRRAVVAGLERDVSSSQSKIDQLAVDCHRAAPAARQARGALPGLIAHRDEVAASVSRREVWLTDHADVVAYELALVEAIRGRTRDLGESAAVKRPAHLVGVLGEVPEHPVGRDIWTKAAGALNAYCERWDIAPEKLRHHRFDSGAQRHDWERVDNEVTNAVRTIARAQHRHVGRDLGIGR